MTILQIDQLLAALLQQTRQVCISVSDYEKRECAGAAYEKIDEAFDAAQQHMRFLQYRLDELAQGVADCRHQAQLYEQYDHDTRNLVHYRH